MTPCKVSGKDLNTTVQCNLAAVYRIGEYGTLYAVSVAGPSQVIQGIAAGIADASLAFSWPALNARWKRQVTPARGGFEVRKGKLGVGTPAERYCDTWHLVAVSKEKGFLLHETDEALWKLLRSDKFTTPLLKSWVPVIRADLKQRNILQACDHFGPCNPSFMLGNDMGLDRVVSDGVRAGRLRIQAVAEAA